MVQIGSNAKNHCIEPAMSENNSDQVSYSIQMLSHGSGSNLSMVTVNKTRTPWEIMSLSLATDKHQGRGHFTSIRSITAVSKHASKSTGNTV